MVERHREVMEKPADDYQIPSSTLCLSQAPVTVSVPSRYPQNIAASQLTQR